METIEELQSQVFTPLSDGVTRLVGSHLQGELVTVLRLDSNEKLGGREEDSKLQSSIVAIEDYLKFELVFCCRKRKRKQIFTQNDTLKMQITLDRTRSYTSAQRLLASRPTLFSLFSTFKSCS